MRLFGVTNQGEPAQKNTFPRNTMSFFAMQNLVKNAITISNWKSPIIGDTSDTDSKVGKNFVMMSVGIRWLG